MTKRLVRTDELPPSPAPDWRLPEPEPEFVQRDGVTEALERRRARWLDSTELRRAYANRSPFKDPR